MDYLFKQLPAEIRSHILKYAGFRYATLFRDDYAANYTYDPILDTLDAHYDEGNKNAIEWIIRNVRRRFWKNNTILAKAIIRRDYKTIEFLNNCVVSKTSTQVPRLNVHVESKNIALEDVSTFENASVFYLTQEALQKLAAAGLSSLIIQLSQEYIFAVDEQVIFHALNLRRFSAAFQLIKHFNVKVTPNIIKVAAARVQNGTDMERFITKETDWKLALNIFIRRDNVSLVRYCIVKNHFHLSEEQFSDSLFKSNPKEKLIHAFNNQITPKTEYFAMLGTLTPDFAANYVFPRLPTPNYEAYYQLLLGICTHKNTALFQYIVNKKWPMMYENSIRRWMSQDLQNCETLIYKSCEDLQMFKCFHHYTWYLMTTNTRRLLTHACFNYISVDPNVLEWLLLQTNPRPNYDSTWYQLFTHHFALTETSLDTASWIINTQLVDFDWTQPLILEELRFFYEEACETANWEKALFLLHNIPGILDESKGQMNFKGLIKVQRQLILTIMVICRLKTIHLDVTGYIWLRGCTIRNFMWILEFADPDHIEWKDILDALVQYRNHTLLDWIERQTTLDLWCYNRKIEFCPKWK